MLIFYENKSAVWELSYTVGHAFTCKFVLKSILFRPVLKVVNPNLWKSITTNLSNRSVQFE